MMDYRRESKMRTWVESRLGREAMNGFERGQRYIEESVELVQAVGLPEELVHKIVAHVYAKTPGDVCQEIGGVGTTLLALCASRNVEMLELIDGEIERIYSLPASKFQERQALNAELGIGSVAS